MRLNYQNAVLTKARDVWEQKPVFLDTETTGLDNNAEIVEISIVDYDGSVLLDTLVKPRNRIPNDVMRVHGITNELVATAPGWIIVWPKVEAVLRDRLVGIYNAEYDVRMFKQSHRLSGLVWRSPAKDYFCIMNMYSDYRGSTRWQKLENAGHQLGIPLPNTHRAKDDTLLAREVFLSILNSGRNP
jgi:DNA polymerase III epsilon subunit-like protein